MRRAELIVSLVFQAGLPAVAIGLQCWIWFSLLTTAPSLYVFIMLLLWVVGFSLYLKAKLSLFRQRQLFVFGPKKISRTNRIFWLLGYLFMFVPLLLALWLFAFHRLEK